MLRQFFEPAKTAARTCFSSLKKRFITVNRLSFHSSIPANISNQQTPRKTPETDTKNADSNIDELESFLLTNPLVKQHIQNAKLARNTKLHLSYVSKLNNYDELHDYPHLNTSSPAVQNALKNPKFTHQARLPPDIEDMDKPPTTMERLGFAEYMRRTSVVPEEVLRKLVFVPLVSRRVVNQTRKGKIVSMYSMAAVGDRNGLVGYGEGKGATTAIAYKKASMKALRNMIFVPRYQDRTVYGVIRTKFHAVHLTMRSRPPGFGLRCSAVVHEICNCAGISDISAKVIGSRNRMNVAKAVFEALQQQRLPEHIAIERGQRFIDVQQQYYRA
ncbi:mitochondrial 37S ribosomal protein MRPS5 [Schizosaccharomyces japonicus yFS275]|uniref:Small ribosomal subunit protein uS5m n=1 Tax=Schizosaccharomyces japonicus (strain yFS275 / FY16936) TaxID=402676 RepID=B6JW58_SCHJY|nr:mitochondrial 37S ribosomal protein MRPS5 [Schizosaccharomyces japonicus yFS275]EEB05609.1 ribosomal protein subunit S5 [Schizosaccharomyces japonicus yFS275]